MKPMTLIGSIFILLAVLLVGVNLAFQNTPPSVSSHAGDPAADSEKLARERLAESISGGKSTLPPIAESSVAASPAPTATTTASPGPTATPTATGAPAASATAGVTASPAATSSATPAEATHPPATAQLAATARPATPHPSTPRPATPRPATPDPATPRPAPLYTAAPRPATPRPAAPRPATRRPPTPRPPAPRSRRTEPPRSQAVDAARLRVLKRQADFDAVRRATLARAAAYPPGSHVRSADVREVAPGQYRVLVVKETPAGTIVEQFGLRATPAGFIETRHRIIPPAKATPQAPASGSLMPLSTTP